MARDRPRLGNGAMVGRDGPLGQPARTYRASDAVAPTVDMLQRTPVPRRPYLVTALASTPIAPAITGPAPSHMMLFATMVTCASGEVRMT